MINIKILKHKKDEIVTKKDISKINDWPDHIVTLDKFNFDSFIDKYPISVVDFWAPWCNPCKTMSPRLRRLSRIYKGKVAFGKINTQEYKKIAKKYNVQGIPNLIFFNYGKKINSLTGVKSVGDIKLIIEDLL